ncbi:MAG: squalene--hopene cyclase [Planctomycetota bacterium]|nr:MAG: squalene--hopene cyclase [Planctomycetota bacterium]
MGAPRSLEDSLREFVRNSPYAVVSLLLHAVVLLVMWGQSSPPVQLDHDRTLLVTADPDPPPMLEPEPPEPPPLEQLEELSDDPEVVDTPIAESTEALVDAPITPMPANTPSVIGPGTGTPNFGPRSGGPGTRKFIHRGDVVQANVEAALRWLMHHQNGAGYWSANAFDDECFEQSDVVGEIACSGRGKPVYDVGVSGLSLLAFLGAGYTPSYGRYQQTVKRGMRWLIDQQAENGNFADPRHNLHTYDHAIATLAMIEASAMSGQGYRYRRSAQRGIDYLMSLKNAGGAWRYGDPGSDEMLLNPSDVSVTGWVVMVLTLARDLDYDVDPNALDDAMVFIEEMTDPATGRTGYTSRGGRSARAPGANAFWPAEQSEAMTAVAMLCRSFADPELRNPNNAALLDKGAELLVARPIQWGASDDDIASRDFYYWYYASYALYQHGGRAWVRWQAGLEQIAQQQSQTGEQRGSWDPSGDPWGSEGGRVYATAMLALTLEVPYRYAVLANPK